MSYGDIYGGPIGQIPFGLQTRPRPKALKPPILLVPQDESRLVAVIQRCTAFEDEVEEHKKKTEEEEEQELEVRCF